jgi:hypothetical protein
MWPYKTGGILKEVLIDMQFSDRIRKMWLFNTGDCLIEVNAWAGLTVCDVLYKDSSLYADLAKKHDHHGLCLFLSDWTLVWS